MKWKFWQKDEADAQGLQSKLPRPRDLPERVGRYLVVELGMDPDQVWNLKAVTRPHAEGGSRHEIRIFNPVAADHSGISIRNYGSLEMYQEMILFEGWIDKKSNQFEIITKKIERSNAA
jgi:hypothetical protein